METNLTTEKAPALSMNKSGGEYPNDGKVIGPAWQEAWDRLRVLPKGEYVDGRALAEAIAKEQGMTSPDSLINILTQAATKGWLERTHRKVAGSRGMRNRTHYRIARTEG
jgi:hypothetical protein